MDLVGNNRSTTATQGALASRSRVRGPYNPRRRTIRAHLAQRPWIGPVALAGFMAVATGIASLISGLPIRDPDAIFGKRMYLMLLTLGVFLAIDIVPRSVVRSRFNPAALPSRIWHVTRERYTGKRLLLALTGVISFYVTYVAYRNLKSYLPFFVDQNLDQPLLQLERTLFGGDPASLLHDLLGTGAAASVLSWAYIFFLALVPISVGAASIWSRRDGSGFWYLMALGLNWTLGVATYYLLPSLGPIFVFPDMFDALPVTGVSQLQTALIEERTLVMAAPHLTPSVQSIAAFASLHVSIVFTAALIAHHLRLFGPLRFALWTFLAMTLVATIYFGWHYVIDDVAGLAIGAASVYLGALATGQSVRKRRERVAAESGQQARHVVRRHGRKQHSVDAV